MTISNNPNSPCQAIGMVCEYGSCKRGGKDYKRPKNLADKGWEDEPIFLCAEHAKELKATPITK